MFEWFWYWSLFTSFSLVDYITHLILSSAMSFLPSPPGRDRGKNCWWRNIRSRPTHYAEKRKNVSSVTHIYCNIVNTSEKQCPHISDRYLRYYFKYSLYIKSAKEIVRGVDHIRQVWNMLVLGGRFQNFWAVLLSSEIPNLPLYPIIS